MFRSNQGALEMDGRSDLSLGEVETALAYALTRRQRQRGKLAQLLSELRSSGNAYHTWDFSSYHRDSTGRPCARWFELAVVATGSGYRVTLGGPDAEWARKRIEQGPARFAAKLKRKAAKRLPKRHPKSKKRYVPKRRSLPKEPRAFVPAPIAERRQDRFVRQFRNRRITLPDAAALIAHVFEVKMVSKYQHDPEKLVAWQLLDSLERNGGRFMQFKRGGCCIRLDLTRQWEGIGTPLILSCTKDGDRKAHARMRRWVWHHFSLLSSVSCRERRALKEVRLAGLRGSTQKAAA